MVNSEWWIGNYEILIVNYGCMEYEVWSVKCGGLKRFGS
jgi:hypothetical protein